MNGCNKVKQIAWTRHGGKLYGVAHDPKGEAIGGVRIDKYDNGVFAVAYDLSITPCDNKLSLTKISGDKFVGEGKQKRVAESSLRKLLAAA